MNSALEAKSLQPALKLCFQCQHVALLDGRPGGARTGGCRVRQRTRGVRAAGGRGRDAVSAVDRLARRRPAGRGLVHFSVQPELSLSVSRTEAAQHFPQKVFTLTRNVEECMPLEAGASIEVSSRPGAVSLQRGERVWGWGRGEADEREGAHPRKLARVREGPEIGTTCSCQSRTWGILSREPATARRCRLFHQHLHSQLIIY